MVYNFCITTQPRSGDELLISRIRSHPNIYITLGKPYCEFHEQKTHTSFNEFLVEHKYNNQNFNLKVEEQDIMHSLNTRDYMENYYDELIRDNIIDHDERSNIKEFLDLIYAKDKEAKKQGFQKAALHALTRYRNYGLTVYGDQLLSGCIDTLQQSEDFKYIILFRKNVLWQYVSTLLPVEVNEHGYTKIIDTKLVLDAKAFKQYANNTLKERDDIRAYIQNKNTSCLEIYYEDLATKNRETLDKVQDFLGVPVQERDLYGINPNNIYEETRPLEAIVTNYKEFTELLQDDEEIVPYFKMAADSVNPFYYEIRKAGSFASLDFLREMYEGKP